MHDVVESGSVVGLGQMGFNPSIIKSLEIVSLFLQLRLKLDLATENIESFAVAPAPPKKS